MSALTASRNTPLVIGETLRDQVAASTKIFKGALVVLNATGYLTNATGAAGEAIRGVAQQYVDNSAGSAGDLSCDVMQGAFEFHNSSSTDQITIADAEKVCYVVDNHTVAKTSNAGVRAIAGVVQSIAPDGKVRVRVGHRAEPAPLAEFSFLAPKISSKASDAEVFRWVAPFACKLLGFQTVLNAVLATGDATVQAKVNGTNAGSTTTGLATITQSGSAAGDVDEALPITTNVDLAKGDILTLVVAGASTATGTFNSTVRLAKK